MLRSEDRILTTHTGSLPRSRELVAVIQAKLAGEEVDPDRFQELVERDMTTVVQQQAAVGIAIANDGEAPRPGFANYVSDRMSGFGGVTERKTATDFERFPGYAELLFGERDERLASDANLYVVPAAQAPVRYDPELAAVKAELASFAQVVETSGAAFDATFVSAASPGIVSTMHLQDADEPPYDDDRDYVLAIADELALEYEYIVGQGHILQLDAPDLALERFVMFGGRPECEYLDRVELHIEAINRAIANLPKERVRLHVCWGNLGMPHIDDPELRTIAPLITRAKVGAITLPLANPRHAHEWRYFIDHPLPDDMCLVAGVIDSTTNYVEHPDLVAERLTNVAGALGDPTRLMAGTDCGFETWAGQVIVAHDVVWAKLAALGEGARRASATLF